MKKVILTRLEAAEMQAHTLNLLHQARHANRLLIAYIEHKGLLKECEKYIDNNLTDKGDNPARLKFSGENSIIPAS